MRTIAETNNKTSPEYVKHTGYEHAQAIQRHALANQRLDQIMRAAAGIPSRKADAARAEVQPILRRCHLTRRPDRQFQHLAKGTQIRIPWSYVIIFPKIDARRADANLFSDFCNR